MTITTNLPIWKTVEVNLCGADYHEFDLVLTTRTEIGADEPSDEIAKKALAIGLEFAPHEVMNVLQQSFMESGVVGDEKNRGGYFFPMNKYGEGDTLLYYKDKWIVSRDMVTFGLGPNAPLVFVKPRK